MDTKMVLEYDKEQNYNRGNTQVVFFPVGMQQFTITVITKEFNIVNDLHIHEPKM